MDKKPWTIKRIVQNADDFLRAAMFGVSLASPIIGVAVGGFMGGWAGAAIGLLAGPAVAVAGLFVFSAFSVTDKTSQKKANADKHCGGDGRASGCSNGPAPQNNSSGLPSSHLSEDFRSKGAAKPVDTASQPVKAPPPCLPET